MQEFIVEKVSNMIFISCEGQVYKAWDEEEFTERKLANAEKKLRACHNYPVKFTRTF